MGTVLNPLIYVACAIGVIYVLRRGVELLGQLVRNQERMACALEAIARKLETGGKP